jgi:hypothetical protein
MNFKQYLQDKEHQWILFAHMFDHDEELCICKLKPFKDMTAKEKQLLKHSRNTTFTLSDMQKKMGMVSYEHFPMDRKMQKRTEIFIGPKEALQEEMHMYKSTYGRFKQVLVVPMKKKTHRHFADIIH